LDIVTKPNGKAGVRSKRSNPSRDGSRVHASTRLPVAPIDGAPVQVQTAEVLELQEALSRSTALLEQAGMDLDQVQQRLVDADAARRHLLNNVASGGDEARRRFASVLHDDVLQALTAAELQLERIRADASRTRHAAPLDQLKATMRSIEESLRNLLDNVSPTAHDVKLDLADAINDRLVALKARTGIEPDVDIRLPRRISENLRSIVYRNIAEALNNVEKHANATRVSVKAQSSDGGILVQVDDDGTGFVVAESLYMPGHLGLVAMRERAQLAGGWCRLESEPGAGARVVFWVPNST
jgi:signal transduction histidine kinase